MPTASRLVLQRLSDNGTQTVGVLIAYDKTGQEIGRWHSLERPWKDNAPRVSCVPTGRYPVVHRYSVKFKRHLHVTDVKGRSWILIHPGNTFRDVVGCIMLGKGLGKVDKDDQVDVTNSKKACDELRALVPDTGTWMEVVGVGEARSKVVSFVPAGNETPSRVARGASGPLVVKVQKALVSLFEADLLPDGEFGPQTEQVVYRFQRANGLVADGIVGPNTLAALNLS